MKIYLSLVAIVLLFTSSAMAKEWYEGGTLHTATVKQWGAGSEHDKIATSGDWIHGTTDNQYIKQAMATDPEILHNLAITLAMCVDQSVQDVGDATGNMKASAVAVLCLGQFQGMNPNLSWLLSKN